jgi:hypothetical protein
MPGARCTRGLVCKMRRSAHTSMQVQRRQSGIPCAMALRLMPRSPRRRIRLVTVAAGSMADRPGWIDVATGSLAPATGVGTTVLPYATTPFVLHASCSLTIRPPFEHATRRRAVQPLLSRLPLTGHAAKMSNSTRLTYFGQGHSRTSAHNPAIYPFNFPEPGANLE